MTIRKYWPLYLLLIAVSVLGTRLAWRLTVSEAGWMPHLDQWADVAGSLVGVERRELGDRDAAEQAIFWLQEVERIDAANHDPEMAIGAAWMLDAPQLGFVRRHVRTKNDTDFLGQPKSWRREFDYETIRAMTEEFESLCRDECLARIETAVRLDDGNVELHRARALLLFQSTSLSLDSVPRQDDWLAVLDECAQADPDNALYDYLAALHLWTSSADYDWENDGYVLRIKDDDRFEEGNARLAAGLAEPHLRFGTQGYAATLQFLNETSISRSDSLNAAGSRRIDSRASSLLYRILRWQSVQSDIEHRASRHDAAVGAMRNVLAISEQVSEAGNYPNLLTPKLILRRWSLANLENMREDHPDLLTAGEAANVSTELAEVVLELKVLEEVGRRMAERAGTWVSDVPPGTYATVSTELMSVFLMGAAQTLIIVCVALTSTASLVAVVFGRRGNGDSVRFDWLRHLIVWLVAFGASCIVLGMFPAQVISARVQAWLVYGVLWMGFISLLLGLLYLFRKRFELPLGQVAVLAIAISSPIIAVVHTAAIIDQAVAGIGILPPIISIAIILLLGLICWVLLRVLRNFVRNQNLPRRRKLLAIGVLFLIALFAVPAGTILGTMTHEIEAHTWISPAVWKEARDLHIEADELQRAMNLQDSRWAWALIQWQVHHGPLVAPILAVIVMTVWHGIRQVRRTDGGLRQALRLRKRYEMHSAGKTVAGSCCVAALVFGAIYLGATPTVIDVMDTYHRVHYERMARPAQAWEEIAELTREVREDTQVMARLQAEIDERNRRLAEQRAWMEEGR